MSEIIPKSWSLGKASDFVINPKNDIVDGPFGSNLKASEYQFDGTPIIRLQNIKRLFFINKNIKFVSYEKAESLSRHSYQRGDIIITKLGDPLGLACIIPDNFHDGIIVADLVRLRVNNSIFDKKYLNYALNSPFVINQINKHIKGTTRPRINLGIIRNLDIPVTSILEQKIITEKLDTLLAQADSIKTRLEKIPTILKRFRQAVLGKVVNIQPAYIERILENSNKHLLKNLTTKIGSGSTPTGGHNNYKKQGIPLIRSLNIYTTHINYDDLAFIDEKQASKLDSVKIHCNDVLLNITGASIGRVNIAPEKFIGGRVNQHVSIIRCLQDVLSPDYLKIYISSPDAQEWINRGNYGATRQALTKKMLEELVIILPEMNEQLEIVRRVEQLFALADTVEKQVNAALERVNHLTQSILAKAFRGELTARWRAENPDLISGENSAAALLEKIKAERAMAGVKKASRKKI